MVSAPLSAALVPLRCKKLRLEPVVLTKLAANEAVTDEVSLGMATLV